MKSGNRPHSEKRELHPFDFVLSSVNRITGKTKTEEKDNTENQVGANDLIANHCVWHKSTGQRKSMCDQ